MNKKHFIEQQIYFSINLNPVLNFNSKRNFEIIDGIFYCHQILPTKQIMIILRGKTFLRLLPLLLLLIQVENCGQSRKVFPRTPTISHNSSNQARLLQAEKPHGFRIYGELVKPVPESASRLVAGGKTLFSISRLYFMKAIMVKNLAQEDTKFYINQEKEATNCDPFIPEKYILYGFDQRTTDMVLLIRFVDVNHTWTAQAINCDFSVRPIYGQINFNVYRLSKTLAVSFQLAVQIFMHEMFHLLGFKDIYYSAFWTDQSRTVRRNQSDVIRKVNGRWMIVTPKVREYVRSYFGCNDQQVGAALEDNGGDGTKLSHWQKSVFRNQLMTADQWAAGKRTTSLTLAYLEDTNFYEAIDKTVSEPAYWGYRKGCAFAYGEPSLISKECQFGLNVNSTCDYYGDMINQCQKTNYSGQVVIDKTNNQAFMCSNPNNQQFYGNFMEFGPKSKCLRLIINKTVHSGCYKAQCNPGATLITFTVANTTRICRMPNQIYTIKGLKIQCPSNFKAFCFVKRCLNNCNNQGLCLNGKCMCDLPWTGISCSVKKN